MASFITKFFKSILPTKFITFLSMPKQLSIILSRLEQLSNIVSRLEQLSNIVNRNNVYEMDMYNDLIYRRIFRRYKLEIILDNPYSPEEGRNVLNIFFNLMKSLSINEGNLLIARSSSISGFLGPIANYLNLVPVAPTENFNFFFLSLPKAPVIFSLDPEFSALIFRDISYLVKLRMKCQDELIIAVKIYITDKKLNNNSVESFIDKNYKNAFYLERDEIYFSESYVRWILHDNGFFEVLGPLTIFSENYYEKTRLLEDQGRFTVVSKNNTHPVYKGLAVYRAVTKTFVNYLEMV